MQRRGLLMGDKKGLSDVVTSVLLILLVLAGIAILWIVIRQFIIGTTGQLNSSALTTSFTVLSGVSDKVVNGKIVAVSFNLRRDQGGSDARVPTIKVVMKDSTGQEFRQDYPVPGGSFNELETKTVTFTNPLGVTGRITAVKVQPVLILPDGSTQQGALSAEQQVQEADHLVLNDVIAWYGFDETLPWVSSSSSVVDQVSGLNGIAKGSVTQDTSSYISGRGSAKFDGTNGDINYIELPANTVANTGLDAPASTDSLTIMAWVKPADDFTQIIFGGVGYNLAINGQIVGGLFNRIDNNVLMMDKTAWKPSKSGLFKANEWTHIVVVISPTANQKFFVNGVEKDIEGTGSSGLIDSFLAIRRLGAYQISSSCVASSGCRTPTTAGFAEFKGSMDEVIISDRVWSSSDIQRVYSYFNSHKPSS